MKAFKSLAVAVASASALMAGTAHALTPTDLPAQIEVNFSGASAVDVLFRELFQASGTGSICVPGTLAQFTNTTAVPGTNHTAYFCNVSEATVNLDLSNPADGDKTDTVKVLFRKRSVGGSGAGVTPLLGVVQPFSEHLVVTAAGCPTSLGTVAGAPSWQCTGVTTTTLKSDAGVSDVEPALLNANGNNLTSITPLFANTFGIAATVKLRNALQAAQGLTVGSDDVSQMPSLSRDQIASIFAGQPYEWSSFKVQLGGKATPDDKTDDTYVGLDQINSVNAAVANPGYPTVHICRRTSTSGTQVQFNTLFMNQNCDLKTALAPLSDNTAYSTTAGVGAGDDEFFEFGVPAVHETSSAETLETCLANLDNSTAGGGGGLWGLGIQSVEKGNTGYRYIAIDGIAPTLKNVTQNRYFDWAAATLQQPQTVTAPARVTGLISYIAANVAKPTVLAGLNADLNPNITGLFKDTVLPNKANSVGYAALSTNGFTGSIGFNPYNPVLTITRNGTAGTSAPATCRRGAIVKDSILGPQINDSASAVINP